MNTIKTVLSLIICSAMIISFRITSFADNQDVISVTFQCGDTISDICRAHGIDYYTYRSDIMRINGIVDESWFNYVQAGQSILIPTGSAAPSEVSSAKSAGADTVSVTVHSGDTIYDLCASQGVDYDQCKSAIMRLNGFTDPCRLNSIKDGESILIPTNIPSGSASAQASVNVNGETMSFTLKPGNTVAGICSVFGIDYDRYKDVIMELNGVTDESAFTRLKAGDSIVLPTVTYSEHVVTEQSIYDDGPSLTVTVKNGNTVIGICEAYGMDYEENKAAIMELNGVTDEAAFGKLKVGDTLLLPTAGDPSGKTSSSITTVEETVEVEVYEGQTLKDICAAYGIDFNQYKEEIMQLNNITDPCKLNQIYEGEKLLIPSRSFVVTATAEKTAPTIVSVVAEEGDTMKEITEKHGIDFNEQKTNIMQLNGITNPCDLNTIIKGQSYLIPSYNTETSSEEEELSIVTVTVQPGDTMKSIVERYGIDYNEYKPLIMQMNGITNSCKLNQIIVGETYIIPCLTRP